MKNKKVLITYASYGSGHKTVANYIYEYLKEHSNYEIKIIDLMDYQNLIGYLSKKTFEQNFKYKINSLIFSFIYEIFDSKITTLPYKQVTKSIFKINELEEDIINYNPDLLISTHFFGNIIVGDLNKKHLLKTKIISIITDYCAHELWLKDEKNVDAFIVSNEMVKQELIDKGIKSKKIYPFGIPISEKFNEKINYEEIKTKYHVNNQYKTFLFFAGGSIGSSFAYKYIKKLLSQEFKINIIFVCGKNTKLKEKLTKLVNKNNYQNIEIIGFSNEVNKLLNICDVVITKPGGISLTECLDVKKPMLLISGNGAQEIYNANFISKNGYGIKCYTSKKLVKVVKSILNKKDILLKMEKKLNKYHKNNSIKKIYDLSKKI